jgi:hypothetical protein
MFEFFLKNRDKGDWSKYTISLNKQIEDINYEKFIVECCNGGFFFGKALLIYPNILENQYPSASLLNSKLYQEFGELFCNYWSFGQDIFGNQFCFKNTTREIILFNIEDASEVIMARDFKEWLIIVEDDFDYLTGYSYYKEWIKKQGLNEIQRLVPYKPFIVGGDYNVSNFVASDYPRYLEYNAQLAKHLHDIPDGTAVRIRYSF